MECTSEHGAPRRRLCGLWPVPRASTHNAYTYRCGVCGTVARGELAWGELLWVCVYRFELNHSFYLGMYLRLNDVDRCGEDTETRGAAH